ncbi:MAG TPA: DUF465 domain-containing protein [Burkholderiales bacterium]|nr:DUF465 domain-containing protein [Burkholderiales bacterium]
MDPHLADLKRRHKELEDEIADALRHRSNDDLMISDLKRRKLHLKEEIERLRKVDNRTAHSSS